MERVQAQIRLSQPGYLQVSVVVVVLAFLLSGFFWLGYWTSELRSGAGIRQTVDEAASPTQPEKPVPTPTQQLETRSEDVVRL